MPTGQGEMVWQPTGRNGAGTALSLPPFPLRARSIRAGNVTAAAAKAALSKALTLRHQRAQHEADKPPPSASVLSE